MQEQDGDSNSVPEQDGDSGVAEDEEVIVKSIEKTILVDSTKKDFFEYRKNQLNFGFVFFIWNQFSEK